MRYRTLFRFTPFLVAAAVAIVPAAASAATHPAFVVNHYATSTLTNHPDSGSQGNNWALDKFTRHAHLHYVGPVSTADCAGVPAHCYEFTAIVADSGHFTTIAGQKSPGIGDGGNVLLYESITGSMSGGGSYQFYSSWKTANRTPVGTLDGAPTSWRRTTSNWPLQFFQIDGPAFWDTSGTKIDHSGGSALLNAWSWSYNAPAGADPACPSSASHWVDGFPDGGSNAVDGNILAPNAAHC